VLNKHLLNHINKLSIEDLKELRSYIDNLIRHTKEKEENSEVIEEKVIGSVTYRLEKVKCGKPECKKCPHGPYWYAYFFLNGKTKSKYIGKKFRKIK